MRYYFGTQITPLLTFTVEPIYTNAGDLAITITFTWDELNGFAQYHGYGEWDGQDDLIAKIASILRERMPFFAKDDVLLWWESITDDKGETWITPVPARKQITADYIDVV